MGFVMGSSSSPLQSPNLYSLFSTSSSSCSSSFSSQSICLFSCPRTAHNPRKNRRFTASMHQESSKGSNLCTRRAIAFVGFAVLPLLKMRAKALESLATEGSELKAQDEEERSEKKLQGNASENPFVSLLSGLGIFASGILGALYALAQEEKATSEAAIESMRNKLKEKEAAIVSMDKKFETELMNEKEIQNEQLQKFREEQQSLVSQLKSANNIVVGLGKELQKEKKIVEELRLCMDGLQTDLIKAVEQKKELQEKLKEKNEAIGVLQERLNSLSLEMKGKNNNLHSLSSTLAEKEMELKKLSSTYQKLQDQLGVLNSENEELKDKLLNNEKELELKIAMVADLKAQIGALHTERDESNRKFDSIQNEYSDLKSSSQKKAAEDAKHLEELEYALCQSDEQLESALSEVSRSKFVIVDLTLERDNLTKMLEAELKNLKNLEQEFQLAQENFERSRNEAIELTSRLQQSRDLCLELEAEVSKARADFAEAQESLQRKAEEARRGAELLTGELTSVKELLMKKTDDLQTVSQELATVVQIRDDLQKELFDVYKKAESAAHDLREEKTIVASLKKEVKTLETQISKEREVRNSLEGDMEVARRSLDEIDQNAMVLSRELERANSHISSLEDEKDVLYQSVAKQKQLSQEARENMEDTHSLVMRLGEERQNMEKRAKKLEEELASAKGEILRLRSRMNSSKTIVNDQHQQTVDVGAKAAVVPVKRTTRRRKAAPQQDNS